MITTDHIRKLIEEKKVTIGTAATTRALKADGLKNIIIASNASQATKDTLARYTGVTKTPVEIIETPNDELGTMCKKPFAISVLGIKK